MVKSIIKVAAGSLMIVSVLIGYMPQPEYLIELTCISNTFGGLLLFADGIAGMAKKKTCFNALYECLGKHFYRVSYPCGKSFGLL